MIHEIVSRGRMVRSVLTGWVVALGAGSLVLLSSGTALGQTWQGGRAGPSLGEIVTVDRTGESAWPYGAEDVAQDGLDRFLVPEQSIDVRSGYAATDATRLWFRAYVSATVPPTNDITVFLFIDRDRSTTTGGSAAAPLLDSRLDSDASGGGYDYVIAIRGPDSVVGLWEWVAAPPGYASLGATALARASAETGTDDDPLRLNGRAHGYLQGTVELDLVGLTDVCQARVLWRTVSDAVGLGNGDLDIGDAGPCRPADANADSVPDIVLPTVTVPEWRCQADADCPGGGICVGGRCVLAPPCITTADCGPGEICNADGQCVATGGDPCTVNADCTPLVCANGVCAPCSASGAACPSGLVCAPDGRCIDPSTVGAGGTSGGRQVAGSAGLTLAPGEAIRGGAFTCALTRVRPSLLGLGSVVALGILGLRRQRRTGQRS